MQYRIIVFFQACIVFLNYECICTRKMVLITIHKKERLHHLQQTYNLVYMYHLIG